VIIAPDPTQLDGTEWLSVVTQFSVPISLFACCDINIVHVSTLNYRRDCGRCDVVELCFQHLQCRYAGTLPPPIHEPIFIVVQAPC